jgi:ABC-type multidrug transport system permease subunit
MPVKIKLISAYRPSKVICIHCLGSGILLYLRCLKLKLSTYTYLHQQIIYLFILKITCIVIFTCSFLFLLSLVDFWTFSEICFLRGQFLGTRKCLNYFYILKLISSSSSSTCSRSFNVSMNNNLSYYHY